MHKEAMAAVAVLPQIPCPSVRQKTAAMRVSLGALAAVQARISAESARRAAHMADLLKHNQKTRREMQPVIGSSDMHLASRKRQADCLSTVGCSLSKKVKTGNVADSKGDCLSIISCGLSKKLKTGNIADSKGVASKCPVRGVSGNTADECVPDVPTPCRANPPDSKRVTPQELLRERLRCKDQEEPNRSLPSSSGKLTVVRSDVKHTSPLKANAVSLLAMHAGEILSTTDRKRRPENGVHKESCTQSLSTCSTQIFCSTSQICKRLEPQNSPEVRCAAMMVLADMLAGQPETAHCDGWSSRDLMQRVLSLLESDPEHADSWTDVALHIGRGSAVVQAILQHSGGRLLYEALLQAVNRGSVFRQRCAAALFAVCLAAPGGADLLYSNDSRVLTEILQRELPTHADDEEAQHAHCLVALLRSNNGSAKYFSKDFRVVLEDMHISSNSAPQVSKRCAEAIALLQKGLQD